MLSESYIYNLSANSKRAIVSTAIGGSYFNKWDLYSRGSWESYALRYNIALVIFKSDLDKHENLYKKNGAWQKFLIPKTMQEQLPNIEEICLLDTDIIISPMAPNIFDTRDSDNFAVVSSFLDLPYPLEDINRRISFFRNKYYSSNYPLDSLIFASPEYLFQIADLKIRSNYFTSGVVVMPVKDSVDLAEIYFTITKDMAENATAWEEVHFNDYIQSKHKLQWLDYRYQVIWNFEMAWKYPFLYEFGASIADQELARSCVENSLWSSYFLHFAGPWFESLAWEVSPIFNSKKPTSEIFKFIDYLKTPVNGLPKGKIIPET